MKADEELVSFPRETDTLAGKLRGHFCGRMTDWRNEAFGGVVVAVVAFFCASMLIKIAFVPAIFYVANLCLVIGQVSSVYGVYAAWRMSRIH